MDTQMDNPSPKDQSHAQYQSDSESECLVRSHMMVFTMMNAMQPPARIPIK